MNSQPLQIPVWAQLDRDRGPGPYTWEILVTKSYNPLVKMSTLDLRHTSWSASPGLIEWATLLHVSRNGSSTLFTTAAKQDGVGISLSLLTWS